MQNVAGELIRACSSVRVLVGKKLIFDMSELEVGLGFGSRLGGLNTLG